MRRSASVRSVKSVVKRSAATEARTSESDDFNAKVASPAAMPLPLYIFFCAEKEGVAAFGSATGDQEGTGGHGELRGDFPTSRREP